MNWKKFDYADFVERTKGKIGQFDDVKIYKDVVPSNQIGTIESSIFNKCAKSIIPFIALRDKVVIMGVWSTSIMGLSNKTNIEKLEPTFKQVVGIGPEVDNIEVGDFVDISFDATIHPIQIDNNSLDLKKMIEFYGDARNIIKGSEMKDIYCISYYVVPSYAIAGIYEIEY